MQRLTTLRVNFMFSLRLTGWLLFASLLLSFGRPVRAGMSFTQVCPSGGIQLRTPDFKPGGIILAAFDRSSMWVYNIDTDRRYPLPDTQPCGTNCRLSRDARWITYVDAQTNGYAKMRLDGTQRTPLVDYAADLEWWSADTLLVWTPGKDAYLQPESGGDRQYLNVEGVSMVQPGGHWGVLTELDGDNFKRALVDLNLRGLDGIAGGYIDLGIDKPYFDASSWSPDGNWFAYVAPGVFDSKVNIAGGEIFGIHAADDSTPTQWTDLNSQYGAVRINGLASSGLSWSPDSTHIAFWVTELLGPNPEANTGSAFIHVLDVNTGEVRAYCGFSTTEHTPNPPRLIWSPDSTHIAFGGNVPGDDKGYLLLALDIESGVFTELSDGIYPQLGGADPIAWGLGP
jgi:WD40-like Beta Propeller Repeat